MSIYRIDHVLEADLWQILKYKSTPTNKHSPILNKVHHTEDIIPPKKRVWVDQPNPLAAFSHALMLFNGEI